MSSGVPAERTVARHDSDTRSGRGRSCLLARRWWSAGRLVARGHRGAGWPAEDRLPCGRIQRGAPWSGRRWAPVGRPRSRHDRGRPRRQVEKGADRSGVLQTGDVRSRPQTRTLGPWDFTEMGSGGIAPGSSWSSSRGGSCSGWCPPAAGVPWAAGHECVRGRRRVCPHSRASPLHPQQWLNPGPVPRTPGYPLVGWQIRQESTTSAIGRGRSGRSM
jgi:hypothetical protein